VKTKANDLLKGLFNKKEKKATDTSKPSKKSPKVKTLGFLLYRTLTTYPSELRILNTVPSSNSGTALYAEAAHENAKAFHDKCEKTAIRN
jgi:hypothetical protein